MSYPDVMQVLKDILKSTDNFISKNGARLQDLYLAN